FQAEDGIRDFHVTGVQTCALPILGRHQRAFIQSDERQCVWSLFLKALRWFGEGSETVHFTGASKGETLRLQFDLLLIGNAHYLRSEERRVGQEGRTRLKRCD